MTNKELAAQCLIEAAELLGESAGRNGVASRMNKHNLLTPDESKYASALDKYKKAFTKRMGEFRDWEEEDEFKNSTDPLISKTPSMLKKGFKSYVLNNEYGPREDNKKLREHVFKEYDNQSNRKIHPIHKLITSRESKNESVDIDALLEEAMDLLDY